VHIFLMVMVRGGDHYVRVNLDVPTKLGRREKQLWEELGKK